MTNDDSDDVLTQTAHRPRARQGVENAMTNDDSDDVLTQTTHRRARRGVEPVNNTDHTLRGCAARFRTRQ